MSDISIVTRDSEPLGFTTVARLAHGATRLEIGPKARGALENGRSIVERIVQRKERVYGVTTGLGALSDVLLDGNELAELQLNTLLSHACGVGAPLPIEQTRAIMVSLVNDLCHGNSGISPAIVDQLVAFLNLGITPRVPGQGSVGYIHHGAHIGLSLIGIGEVFWRENVATAREAMEVAGLKPVTLGPKDALCLVNGTRCLTGLACLALERAQLIADWADVTGALSFEALTGQTDAFDAEMLALKPHPGLLHVGERLRRLLKGSEIIAKHQGRRTQDALSLRAIPQVHGAVRDQFDHAQRQIEIELGSATDNPLLLGTADDYRAISNAHPHGESVAMAVDLMTIALAELGSMAERRIDRLLNPAISGLPAFLVRKPGVNSGFMIAQYSAASLTAENKLLSQPAVIDNLITSAQQEDHISLGTPGALKCLRVLENVRSILAIEYLCACQALEFYPGLSMGVGTGNAYKCLRRRVTSLDKDRFLSPDIAVVENAMRDRQWLDQIEN